MITKRHFMAGAATTSLVAIAGCGRTDAVAKSAKPAGAIGDVTATGAFTGDSNHVTTGGVSISRLDGVWMVNLGEDFYQDGGAPDMKVALGSNGYRKESQLGPLRALTGAQSYAIPASLDVANYNQVWIWCEEFAVPIGHADLTLT